MQRLYCLRAAASAVLFVIVAACLAAAQGGAVRGKVEDTDGHPIKGATVKASNPNGRPPMMATTDEKGRFALIGLSGGAWTFVAEAPGFITQEGIAQIRSTTTGNAPIAFTLQRSAILPPTLLAKQVQADITAADEMRNAGRFDQAIAAYQEIADRSPTLTMVSVVMADAIRQKAARETNPTARAPLYDRAIAIYEQVLKSEPENERPRIELAMTQVQKGSFDDAERTLGAAAEAQSASREMLYSLAEVRFGKGDTAGAERLFQRALNADPSWLRPKLRLGVIAYRKGDRTAATDLFRAILNADAGSPEAAEAGTYLKELNK